VTQLDNKKILAAVQLVLNSKKEYGLSVDYDGNRKLIIKVAPEVKVKADNVSEKMKSLLL
jgi:hypothetical protein